MTKRAAIRDTFRDGVPLSKKGTHTFQDVLDDTRLFVECCKNVAAIDAKSLAENYADGKAVLYVRLRNRVPHRCEHNFSFLIAKDTLEFGWPKKEFVDVSAVNGEAVAKGWIYSDEVFPVLVDVGHLVDGPEGVISSGVWALGTNEHPLFGSEFLFQSVLPGHPRVWEFVRLPSVPVDASKWEPYARRATLDASDQCNRRLVERGPKPEDDIDNIEGNVDVEVFLAACDYVRQTRFLLDPQGVGVGLQEPVDGRFEVYKLSLSTGDIFL